MRGNDSCIKGDLCMKNNTSPCLTDLIVPESTSANYNQLVLDRDILITSTVIQLLLWCEKFLRGLREPYLRKYFLPRSSNEKSLVFSFQEIYILLANINHHKPVYLQYFAKKICRKSKLVYSI